MGGCGHMIEQKPKSAAGSYTRARWKGRRRGRDAGHAVPLYFPKRKRENDQQDTPAAFE